MKRDIYIYKLKELGKVQNSHNPEKVLSGYLIIFLLACVTLSFSSCKKFVNVDAPVTQINSENIYETPETAISALTGIYATIARGGIDNLNFASGLNSFSHLLGLSADEYRLSTTSNATFNAFYRNALLTNSTTSYGGAYWPVLYDYIYTSNAAIEGLEKSNKLPYPIKNQLLGEAKFIRAFLYFYLTNLYGEVPLVTSTDYTANQLIPRSSINVVYSSIINDLLVAQEMLSSEYLDASLQKYPSIPQRTRPTKAAAYALLSRVYLYNKDWQNAEKYSSNVINNSALFDLVPLNNVFLKNSKEAIWQLQPVTAGRNTEDARIFVVPTSGFGGNNPVCLSTFLLNSFEPGDQRSANNNWIKNIVLNGITYYYPYKYKVNITNSAITTADQLTEYMMVFRLAEQFLIRAEAKAQQENLVGARADINIIRRRAGLLDISSNDKTTILDAILKERQVELFSEWGHRWLDLKRTGKINSVMTAVTPSKSLGGTWNSFQQYFPISLSEIQRNANMTQTPGYQ